MLYSSWYHSSHPCKPLCPQFSRILGLELALHPGRGTESYYLRTDAHLPGLTDSSHCAISILTRFLARAVNTLSIRLYDFVDGEKQPLRKIKQNKAKNKASKPNTHTFYPLGERGNSSCCSVFLNSLLIKLYISRKISFSLQL